MRREKGAMCTPVLQFTNCRILRGRKLLREDLWVRGGRILDPERLFFEERLVADEQRDCGGCILAPGFIDVQINGVHLEGPFISREKRGAHPEAHLRSFEANAFHDVLATYGPLDNVRIVTLAPELGRSHEVIQALTARGICVSLGHSVANLRAAEEAVQSGATFITHLFNAMLPFHHRDPGIVGLLTSDRLPPGRHIFYGMISDGMHTNPAALRIAHRAHPQGLVLVTDAVPALGLGNGRHTLGQQEVEVDGLTAYVAGTKTLSGSIAPMDVCIRHFLQATGFPGGEHWECGQGPTHRKFTAGDEDSKQADGLEPRVTGTEATAPKRRAFTPYEPWPGACGIAGLGRLQCRVGPGGCVSAPRPAAGTGEAQGDPGLWG
ncbi:N-acetylglucosamine-6-phosphate deacetylase isoform X9 [Pteropus medius]|uniref:N-acetylglucosamine-6-phosphate deacetylase n=1 Tax=Pteropus vampyrus TaxID=132908 RepID=A0A6P6BQ68_PTEVA|nr:N-acetylglucosamine-6-phosphate deacetylase isoform X9 [Pteropus vampyrus]XP_039740985.1 N-acetylglucosamine-6-phosphate deacetylase isoform X9 [Pteropus giganteus]